MSDATNSHSRGTAADTTGFYIRTFTGLKFYWDQIETNSYALEDIAHALANNCRWTGHVKRFYSVAEHCINASYEAPEPHRLGALLHDANEAYLHDMPSPLKWYLAEKGFTVLSDLEARIDAAIFKAYNIPYPMHAAIKEVDRRMLATESRDLMPPGEERLSMERPYEWRIRGWAPKVAEQFFLQRFRELIIVAR